MKLSLYILTAISALVLFVAHYLADNGALYFKLWWFDIPMHVFGGFCIALASVCLYRLYPKMLDAVTIWLGVLLIVFAVGLLWELYELILNQIFNIDRFDLYDIIADMINDMIGAVAGLLLAKYNTWYAK